MRKNIFFFAMALLAGLVLSCRDDVEVPAFIGTDEITILPSDLETKAPLSTFPTSRGFVVGTSYKATTSGTGTKYFSGTAFGYNSTAQGWKASTAKYWPIDGYLDILAYSTTLGVSGVSWSSDGSSSVSMSVPDNGTAQDDIMCAGAVNKTKGALSLAFTHAQAQVALKAYADEAYNSSTNVGVTINSITLASAKYSGTLTATRNASGAVSYSWSDLGSANTKAVDGASLNISATAAASANSIGTGILLPTQASVGFTVNYTLHNGKDASGNPVDKTLSYSYSPSSSTWSAGNKYEYTIHFTEGQVSVAASLSAWTGAAQTWLYATGNATSHQGANFALASGQPVYWRESGSDSYEALTYSSGTYGSSVVYESANYLVTITAAGSLFEVSYESKRYLTGIRVAIQPASGITLSPGSCDSIATVNFNSVAGEQIQERFKYYNRTFTNLVGIVYAKVFAKYSNGEEELIENLNSENTIIDKSFPADDLTLTYRSSSNTVTKNYNDVSINGPSLLKFRIQKGPGGQFTASGSSSFQASVTVSYTAGGKTVSAGAHITMIGNITPRYNGDKFVDAEGEVINIDHLQYRSDVEYYDSEYPRNTENAWQSLNSRISSLTIPDNDLVTQGSGLTLIGKTGFNAEGEVNVTANYLDALNSEKSISFPVYGYDKVFEFQLGTGLYYADSDDLQFTEQYEFDFTDLIHENISGSFDYAIPFFARARKKNGWELVTEHCLFTRMSIHSSSGKLKRCVMYIPATYNNIDDWCWIGYNDTWGEINCVVNARGDCNATFYIAFQRKYVSELFSYTANASNIQQVYSGNYISGNYNWRLRVLSVSYKGFTRDLWIIGNEE